MVAFGKKLKERQIVEWQQYYINYKSMKKKVKQYVQQIQQRGGEQDRVHKDFSKMLDNQIEKIVLFLLEQQGALAERLSKLGEEREKYSSPGQEPSFEKICELRDAYREVGQDLLKLNFYMEMNAIGIRKILKKFDKQFGSRFTDYYVRTRANHPYSQLQQVFKHVGIGAVAGAITRNLGELQECQGSYASIYDKPLSLQDPVIDKIKAAVDRLTHSTNLLRFVAKHALIMEEELPAPPEEQVDDERYSFMSLLLNLFNTFLYMVNTYIIVPTADDYALSLGAAATVCGIVIGAMAVAQVFSSVYFSAWSNKSYFKPLVFSSIVLFVGNIMYAMAYDSQSIWLLLIGRLFCGLGSARAVNRRYISDCVPLRIRIQASAGFVSSSAAGMACGPALAWLLQTDFKIYKFTFNQDTLPGWVMAVAWLLYLILLLIFFKEPVREDTHTTTECREEIAQSDTLEKGIQQPLLESSENKQQNDDDDDEESEEAVVEFRKPATSIGSAYRLLTPSVKEVYRACQLRLMQIHCSGRSNERCCKTPLQKMGTTCKGRLVMPQNSTYIPLILAKFHGGKVGGHSGVLKTYQRAVREVFWPGMRRDIQQFVNWCAVCQQNKTSTLSPAGLLQALPIPDQIWDDVIMDFIEGLLQPSKFPL